MQALTLRGKSFAECESGLAFIEFAFSVTLLLILLYGGVEISRLILILQKVEKTSMMVSNVISQAAPPTNPTQAQLSQLLSAVPDLMYPYGADSNEFVVISDVSVPATGTNPILNWQSCGGSLAAQSKIGTANGQVATLPSGFSMTPGEEVVFAEVYYRYSPILTQNIISGFTLYRYSGFMPRLGSLSASTFTCP